MGWRGKGRKQTNFGPSNGNGGGGVWKGRGGWGGVLSNLEKVSHLILEMLADF